MFDDFVALSKSINDCEFDIRKSSYEGLVIGFKICNADDVSGSIDLNDIGVEIFVVDEVNLTFVNDVTPNVFVHFQVFFNSAFLCKCWCDAQ